jgi:hypothetical protein
MAPPSLRQELDAPFTLNAEQIASYRDQGYIRLNNVLSRELLEHYRPVIEREVALAAGAQPLDEQLAKDRADQAYAAAFTKSSIYGVAPAQRSRSLCLASAWPVLLLS